MPDRAPWRRRPSLRPREGRRPRALPAGARAPAGRWLLLIQAALAAHAPPAAAAQRPPQAAEVLRRAEEVRNPDLHYAADFTLRVSAPVEGWPDRESSFTLVARGRDHSVVVMQTPRQFFGSLLLIAEGRFWFLPARASSPIELSPRQVLQGDIAYGDLARANLGAAYQARLDGEERLDDAACWRLELTRANERALYSRVRFWVEKRRFLPAQLEYYGETGALLRTARYYDYAGGPLGLRAMRIEATSSLGRGERTTMTFSNLRRLDASTMPAAPEGLAAMRDAALAREAVSSAGFAEQVLGALARRGP